MEVGKMNRRAVIQSLGLISTHALFPSILAGFVSSCTQAPSDHASSLPAFFSGEELEAMAEIVDLILPATKTRSASAVNTHHFLDEVFALCLNEDQQKLVREGLAKLLPGFAAATDKLSYLTEIDQKAYQNEVEWAFFRTIKQYTLVGFFTSQEGITQASHFAKYPGDYQGDVPVDENTLNLAKTNLRYYL
jgi:hypothetical protein